MLVVGLSLLMRSARGMSNRIASCEVGNAFLRSYGKDVEANTAGNEGFGARLPREERAEVRAVEKLEMRFQRVGLLVRRGHTHHWCSSSRSSGGP